jgi:hypothetical protein
MNLLSTTFSRTLESFPGPPSTAFPDLSDLLPFVAVCLGSMICTALWLLAVSGYVSRGRVGVAR